MTMELRPDFSHPGERQGPGATDWRRRASTTNRNRRNQAPAFAGVARNDEVRSKVAMHRMNVAIVTRTNTRTSATFATFRP